MADPNIATFQHLLKRLEEQSKCLNILLSQVSFVSSRLNRTRAALKTALETWKSDIEKR